MQKLKQAQFFNNTNYFQAARASMSAETEKGQNIQKYMK